MAGDSISGKVALVTGGSKGLGLEIVKLLIEEGCKVAISYRDNIEAARELSISRGVHIYKADLEIEEDLDLIIKMIELDLGEVSILVNNASSFETGPIIPMGIDRFSEGFDGVIYPTILPILKVAGPMKAKGYGRILNIGMAGATEVKGYREVAAHAAAKTALAVLTKSLSLELEDAGITVNMLSPGIMDRPDRDEEWRASMIERYSLSRLIPPEEVAKASLELIKGQGTGLLKDYL